MSTEEKKAPLPADPVGNNGSKAGYQGPPLYGVRSYLHQFYQVGEKNPSIFEEDEGDEYLLQPADFDLQRHGKLWYHKPVLWKALVWIGINFLVFGIIGIFVAYLVPREKIYIETADRHYFIIQKAAEEYNNNLELVKLVALAFFCSGAVVTVIALLIPSVIWKECMDRGGAARYYGALDIQEPIRVRIRPAGTGVTLAAVEGGRPPLILGKGAVGVQAQGLPPEYTAVAANTPIQPQRKAEEAFLTKEGMKAVASQNN